jgi:hypothetical protein
MNRKALLHVLLAWAIVLVLAALAFAVFTRNTGSEPRIEFGTARIVAVEGRELVECEFEEPLKYITTQIHWYGTNEEMFADYILLADPADHEEIWGWSDCAWDRENNSAWCDIYVVKPTFVHADMNIDTLGHELLHGACGGFHD